MELRVSEHIAAAASLAALRGNVASKFGKLGRAADRNNPYPQVVQAGSFMVVANAAMVPTRADETDDELEGGVLCLSGSCRVNCALNASAAAVALCTPAHTQHSEQRRITV